MTEQERLALIDYVEKSIKNVEGFMSRRQIARDSDLWKVLEITRIALSALQDKPAVPEGWAYIQFKDASKSQMFRCQIVWTDGLNSALYDEEGSPLLVSTKSYEIKRPAPEPGGDHG